MMFRAICRHPTLTLTVGVGTFLLAMNIFIACIIVAIRPRPNLSLTGHAIVEWLLYGLMYLVSYAISWFGLSAWGRAGSIRRLLGALLLILVLVGGFVGTSVLLNQLWDTVHGRPWDVSAIPAIAFLTVTQWFFAVAMVIILWLPTGLKRLRSFVR
jgi:hypothetical protein